MLAAQSVELVVSNSDPSEHHLLFTPVQDDSGQRILVLPVSGEFGGEAVLSHCTPRSSWGSILLGCALDLQCREEEEGWTHMSSPCDQLSFQAHQLLL